MTRRARRLFAALAGLLAAGVGYALFCRTTGLAVPCLFRTITGLSCPGCGVTRMCLALLALDLPAAWAFNPGLFLLLPILALLGGRLGARYVREGACALTRWENRLVWALVAWLLVWGVVRNLL